MKLKCFNAHLSFLVFQISILLFITSSKMAQENNFQIKNTSYLFIFNESLSLKSNESFTLENTNNIVNLSQIIFPDDINNTDVKSNNLTTVMIYNKTLDNDILTTQMFINSLSLAINEFTLDSNTSLGINFQVPNITSETIAAFQQTISHTDINNFSSNQIIKSDEAEATTEYLDSLLKFDTTRAKNLRKAIINDNLSPIFVSTSFNQEKFNNYTVPITIDHQVSDLQNNSDTMVDNFMNSINFTNNISNDDSTTNLEFTRTTLSLMSTIFTTENMENNETTPSLFNSSIIFPIQNSNITYTNYSIASSVTASVTTSVTSFATTIVSRPLTFSDTTSSISRINVTSDTITTAVTTSITNTFSQNFSNTNNVSIFSNAITFSSNKLSETSGIILISTWHSNAVTTSEPLNINSTEISTQLMTSLSLGQISSKSSSKDNEFTSKSSPINTNMITTLYSTSFFISSIAPSKPGQANLIWIIGPILGGIALIAIILFLICFCYRKKMRKSNKKPYGLNFESNDAFELDRNLEIFVPPKPIKISDFADRVDELHRHSDYLFSVEYKGLNDLSPKHPKHASELPQNRIKNRYANILTYDFSRVKLKPFEDDEDLSSDYINASYIPGYSSRREFIAAQGPMNSTIDDFWRMIWEQDVHIIVMVTNLMERGREKCALYWPTRQHDNNNMTDLDDSSIYYGDVFVKLISESSLNHYIIRILDVQMGNSQRRVIQYHFIAWPDFGVPDQIEPTLNFVREVRMSINPSIDQNPILVHCSAGVGRTGTYILLDHILRRIENETFINLFATSLEMRNYRCNMIQTEAQYIFAHDVIRHAIIKQNQNQTVLNLESDEPRGSTFKPYSAV